MSSLKELERSQLLSEYVLLKVQSQNLVFGCLKKKIKKVLVMVLPITNVVLQHRALCSSGVVDKCVYYVRPISNLKFRKVVRFYFHRSCSCFVRRIYRHQYGIDVMNILFKQNQCWV